MQDKIIHKHHIIPRHMGGSDDSDNLIEVSIEEHANIHRELWLEFNKKEDYIAWKFLSGQKEDPQAWFYKSSLGGKENLGKLHWFNPITKQIKKSRISPGNEWINQRNPEKFDKNRISKHSHDAKNSIWCHNPENKSECKMINSIEYLPTNWIIGRSNFHITDRNKTKNYRFWFNPRTNEETSSLTKPDEEWILGRNPSIHKKLTDNIIKYSKNRAGSKWYHNPNDINQTKMIKENEIIPPGWMIGRYKKKGGQ